MLLSLHIENYALIERLDLSFREGLTVVTGETGAGKSILLGALSLVLGQRADSRVIREGADKSITEALFDIKNYNLQTFFESNELEFDPDQCLIRRELYANGKSRSFVNDSLVSLGILKELTGRLTDIHSQHQSLLLSDNSYQRDVVDAILGKPELKSEYQRAFSLYKTLQANLVKLEEKNRKANSEEDYLRFQFDQLEKAGLKEGEDELLDAEWERLSHAEEIQQGLGRIFTLLDDDEHGVNTALKTALQHSESLQKVFTRLEETSERLRSALIDLRDLARETEIQLNDNEVDPARMEQVRQRLDVLYSLQQKHHLSSTTELIALREELRNSLSLIESGEDDLIALRQETEVAQKEAIRLAGLLTEARRKVLPFIEKQLTGMLTTLGMPHAAFKIELFDKALDVDGKDTVNFLFSANKNVTPQPLERIASGGEISRIMLCIKALIADYTHLPTLVFDEIDTGISGEVAHRMGEIMRHIASKRQVISITHLPQVAAKGQQHYKVLKTQEAEKTVTSVVMLDSGERMLEIAQMLSGANVTDAAIRNAQALMHENQIQ